MRDIEAREGLNGAKRVEGSDIDLVGADYGVGEDSESDL